MKLEIKTLAASLMVAAPVIAGEAPKATEVVSESPSVFSGKLVAGYSSSYEFRGVDFGDHLVDVCLSTGFDLGNDVELGLGTWYGSLVQDDYTELNLVADVTKSFGAFELGAGYTYYYFGESGAKAHEVGLFGSYQIVPAVAWNLGGYYDFETEGTYIETSLAAETQCLIWDRLTWAAEIGVAYNVDYYVDGDGFNHSFLEISAPITLTDNATLTPFIRGTLAMDVLEDSEDDLLIGGVSLAVTF
ncbi:hypothetical protein [Sulfuriroseicoccus oceanibius]|uniref:Uncharacterized protein n=1 Tax=Sulfuriroseicoccus oceanibius TaxID=2707525 RepID=A0A6B3L946_9BACT|nr:hypothetical protein [Sulfuriroseicoccus oceanibius]QQL44893.1 hypothetical protein G3M56_013605 [Sulfuriroseicoccus oceanibius]